MRILLYGGSFDPPHYGHLNNLRAAAARVCPDRVVVMPAGVSPFKQGTSAPGPLRVEMCGCFAELAREMGFGLEVSGWEVEQAEQGRKNYSVLTLEKLARENPGDELYLAIGSDMLLSFDGWHRWEDILRLAHLVVTSRNIGDDPALHAKARQLDASARASCSRRWRRCLWRPASSAPASPPVRNVKTSFRPRYAGSSGARGCTPKETKSQMNQKQAKELVRSRLSDKRYEHTLNVKKMAVRLAKRYGVDEDKAALAALLHDSAKEISKDEMRELMRQYPQYAEGGEERPVPVWHGICAAILARTRWGVEDEAILSAIACHTAGKAGMSKLDKVVYLADMTSKERDWPGVGKLRKLEMKDLDAAMLAALKQTNDFVLSQGKPLDPQSAAAYEDILSHQKKEC